MSLLLAATTAASKIPATLATLPPAAPVKGAATTATNAVAQPVVQQPMTWFQQHASWLTHTVAAIGILAAIGIVVLLALQTTKQEGLSGSIGGRVESAYKGRPGAEEQLKRLTGFVVGVFLVSFVILSLTGI